MKKKIILGITGCIAAYKAPDLARMFLKSGCEVNVIMTEAAAKFITPLTLESITGNKVTTSLFEETGFAHLDLAKNADLFIVAPSTANFIAKAAAGIADDALSTVFLAAQCSKVIAPAMNFRMYNSEMTKGNIESLQSKGVYFVPPEEGELACGEKGEGRLADIEDIYKYSQALIQKTLEMKGKKFIVTAGGTREKIDAVRCLTNLSSGKTGKAIALELAKRGAEVTLLSSADETLPGVQTVSFDGHNDLKKLLNECFTKADCLIMAAAVSDYKPKEEKKEKIARKDKLILELEATADLLKEISGKKDGKIIVGFAAETSDPVEKAYTKLKEKNLDMIVANDVSKENSGIGHDYCDFTVLNKDGKTTPLGRQKKTEAAASLVDIIAKLI